MCFEGVQEAKLTEYGTMAVSGTGKIPRSLQVYQTTARGLDFWLVLGALIADPNQSSKLSRVTNYLADSQKTLSGRYR